MYGNREELVSEWERVVGVWEGQGEEFVFFEQ